MDVPPLARKSAQTLAWASRTGRVGRRRRTPRTNGPGAALSASGRLIARALWRAALAGEWSGEALRERLREAVPVGRWDVLSAWLIRKPPPLAPTLADVVALARHPAVRTAVKAQLVVRRWFIGAAAMGARRWPVAELAAVGDVAAALNLRVEDLLWFADPKHLNRRAPNPPLWHYHFRWLLRDSGGARLVEAPKGRAREVQRWLLRNILDVIPPHDAAHGFRRGRSALTCATVHVGQAVVLRLDVEDFFASVRGPRVTRVFAAAGYSPAVASVLAGLCTVEAPTAVLAGCPLGGDFGARARQRLRLVSPHLPTGAPTSPALANLACFGLDVRLAAAAKSVGARYTRYADDLTFSGDEGFARRADRFAELVGTIVRDEGFRLNLRKTRAARRGARQTVVGVVVNVRPALARRRYDELKAVLHNVIVHGPSTQNRDGHADFRAWLTGTVAAARAIDPVRGGRLAAQLMEVDWGR